MDHRDIARIQARTRRYWNVDGIPELLIGGFTTFWGLAELAPEPARRYLLGIGVPVLGVWFAFRGNAAMIRLKARVTYPRTGYVELRRSPRPRQVAAIAAMAGLILGTILVTGRLQAAGWADPQTLILALVFAVASFGTAIWMALPRFVLLGLVALAAGLLPALAGVTPSLRFGVFAASMGTAYLLSGALTLSRFLRRNPLPEA